MPETRLGRFLLDVPILARERVRFVGEKVVAVAAESPDIAEEALALIDVRYEELPAVFDPLEAMRENSPRIHAQPESYRHPPVPEAFLHGGIVEFFPPIPNVVSQVFYRHGNPTLASPRPTRSSSIRS
jgi:CO/xanthine dehydrogenase Mo-binding subunit